MRKKTLFNSFKKIISATSAAKYDWQIKNDEIVSEKLPQAEAEALLKGLSITFDTNLIKSVEDATTHNYAVIMPIYLIAEKSPHRVLKKLFMYLSDADMARLKNIRELQSYVQYYKSDQLHRISLNNKELFEKALNYINSENESSPYRFLKIEPHPQFPDKVILLKQHDNGQIETVTKDFAEVRDWSQQEMDKNSSKKFSK